jgi:molybdenum cofactor cytidylyltransferase
MGRNKLLVPAGKIPLIRKTVEIFCRSRAAPILVVVGHEREKIREALAEAPCAFIGNDRYAEGKATSIAAGIRALPDDAPGVIFAQGDMPHVRVETVNRLLESFQPGEGSIVVPVFEERMGSPKIFDRKHFPALLAQAGESTGMALIQRYPEKLRRIAVEDKGILIDVDTREHYLESL